jgi:hypothetical protein
MKMMSSTSTMSIIGITFGLNENVPRDSPPCMNLLLRKRGLRGRGGVYGREEVATPASLTF